MKYLKCNVCGKIVSNKPVANDLYIENANIICHNKIDCEKFKNERK